MRLQAASFAIFTALCAAHTYAQSCPRENPAGPSIASTSRVLTGRIVLHQGLRTWLALQLPEPVCGGTAVELTGPTGLADSSEAVYRSLEVHRGCNATITGALALPATGYFSELLYSPVASVVFAPGCLSSKPLADLSRLWRDRSVRAYTVRMHIHYRGEGHVDAAIRSKGRPLSPWQAYASYDLTGGFVLYGYCAKDYHMSHVHGTPALKAWQIDEAAAANPEGAAAMGAWNTLLAYSCRRGLQ